MEGEKRKNEIERKETEICYSKAIKAGKRIYYLDVKKSRNDDLFLAITESKKRVVGNDNDTQVTYEKHKIFLYKEDFEKFVEGLHEVIGFITKEQGVAAPRVEHASDTVTSADANDADESDTDRPTLQTASANGETKRNFFDKFKF